MKKRLLGVLMLTFLIGGGSLFTLAENITVATQDFDLGNGIIGKWDKDTQTLAMTGQGKIIKEKWNGIVGTLRLTQVGTEEVKIHFGKQVQFPDNASAFFKNIQSAHITFEDGMKTDDVTNMRAMFNGAKNFNTNISGWNVSKVIDMAELFQGAEKFNQPLKDRNTSKVQNMRDMFNGATKFNQPLTNWKTQSVGNTIRMFCNAENFNADVSNWDLSNARNLSQMFTGATKFNQPLTNWKTSENLQDISNMFNGAKTFNQDISHFETKNVTNLDGTFAYSAFNGDISNWDVSNVTSMRSTFAYSKFVGNISNWNVEKVKTMNNMFAGSEFNGDLSKRKTKSLTDMRSMFQYNKVFNQDLGNFDTSKVTTMEVIFGDAEAFEGKGIEKWNVEKVEHMGHAFQNAFSFNADISKWNPQSLVDGKNFIHRKNQNGTGLSFSRENYDKLLTGWNEKLKTNKPNFILTIEAPYCFEKEARESLKTKGYNIHGDRRDCQLEGELFYETGSITTITSTLTIGSLLPADQIKARIVATGSTASYSNWQCSVENALSPGKIKCTFDVTSTENGQDIKLEITDGVETITETTEYLVDGEGPELPQVYVNSSDINRPLITLAQFPLDRGGAGVKSCSLFYTGADETPKTRDIGSGEQVQLLDLKPLSDSHKIHTIKVQCKDMLENWGDTNEIKFPPIIEFLTGNKTIVKKDTIFTGAFTVYSPNGKDIDTFSVLSPDVIGVTKISCTGAVAPIQSWEFTQGNWQVNGMGGKNDNTHRITCSYEGVGKQNGSLKLQVTDVHGAQGQNGQSFSTDTIPPALSIAPLQAISSGNIELTITVTDNLKLDPHTVKVDGSPIDLTRCSENTTTRLVCTYVLSGPITDKKITLTAADSVGHESSIQSEGFSIDTQDPSITNGQITYENNGTLAKVSFKARDQGLGFRTQAEENEDGFDWNSLTYGFASQADCSDYESSSALPFGTAREINAHFDLSRELYDSENGKYLCIQAKDKVGRQTLVTLGRLDFPAPSPDPNLNPSPTAPQVGYSGGGGNFSLKSQKEEKADPQQNSTPTQDQTQEKKSYPESDLFNPTIEDGKCYTRRPHLGILTSQLIPTNDEYNKAQSFLWSYEMTKFDSVDGYDPYRNLSRQEAAKIFSNFAINVLCRQPNKKLTVNYSDTQDSDPSLKPYIELAYQLGIMKGSGQGDGVFRPFEFISKAEVNAVLIRMLLKSYLDETGMLRYTPYNQASSNLNIITQDAGLEPVARNHVALMLFRAYKQQVFDWKEIDYFSYVLKQRANFVK